MCACVCDFWGCASNDNAALHWAKVGKSRVLILCVCARVCVRVCVCDFWGFVSNDKAALHWAKMGKSRVLILCVCVCACV